MPEQDPRQLLAERFSLLWVEAGEPTYEALAREAQNRAAGDVLGSAGGGNGRPTRITKQAISRWRNAQVPHTFHSLSAVLGVLIPEARKRRPTPVVENLYNGATWRLLWSEADAARRAGRTGAAAAASAQADNDDVTPDQDAEDGGAQICPYRGLAAYDTEHAEFFYGRARATTALVSKLSETGDTGGMIALVGASGAGKSSLLRAGLLPALRKGSLSPSGEQWLSVFHTPGEDPCAQLSHHVPELAETLASTSRNGAIVPGQATSPNATQSDTGDDAAAASDDFVACTQEAIRAYAEREGGPGARLVLIVDQAEELFTLCSDEQRRALYMDTLVAACTPRAPAEPAPALVLFAVRADFYQRCMDFTDLADALQHRQMLLGPMNTSELREAITGPADAVGLRLEAGLFELLIRDMGIRVTRSGRRADNATYDAGVLPLLSHALRATWQHRKAGKLTIAGYRSARGIQGAVEATAERAWADLDPDGRDAAMQMLVTLTRLSHDTHDTRRRYDKQRLLDQARHRAATERALETLVAARLVTLDAEKVEITHEALLHAWPRLRHQLEKDRAGILVRQELEEDAAEWATERDSALLYRGSRLANARAWGTSDTHRDELSSIATAFLDASIAQRRRSATLRRTAIALLSTLSIIASIAAAVAIRQAHNAAQERDNAIFTQVVAEADRLQAIDPSLAAQLDLVAHGMRPNDVEVAGRVLSTQNTPLAAVLPGSGNAAIDYTAFSPDGRTLATASNVIQLWDLTNPGHRVPLGPPLAAGRTYVSTAAFTPDGRLLVSTGGDGILRIWDVGDRNHPVRLAEVPEGHGSSSLLAISAGGRIVATGGADGTVTMWDITDPAQPHPSGPPLTGHTGIVRAIAFSPDGRRLAAGGDDHTVLLYDVADPARPTRIGPVLRGHTEAVRSVAFSLDGRLLASGSDDKSVRLWNVSDPAQAAAIGDRFGGHKGSIWSVAFSPDGRTLASGSQDGTTKLWNVSDPSSPTQLGADLYSRTGGIYAVGFSPDGGTLATGGDDGTTQLWTLPTTVLAGPSSRVFSVAFSPDGHILAVSSHDHSIWLWNLSDPHHPAVLGQPLIAHNGIVTKIAFSPDGRTLASSSGDDHTTRLWDLTDLAHPVPIGAPMPQHTQYEAALAFSPDGRTLVTSDTDTSVRIWDITDKAHPSALGPPIAEHRDFVQNVAIGPDPARTVLAIASYDGTITLWNITDPRHPQPLGAPLQPGSGKVRNLTFSPDGHTLATTGEDKTIHLWDVTDPAKPLPTQTLLGHHGAVRELAFTPEGAVLASGGADKTARVWSLGNPEPGSTPLTGHTGTVTAVKFSPDGKTLATGSDDNTARLWDLTLADSVTRICSTTQGALTAEQWSQLLPQLPYTPACP